ncbi:MAG: type II secretion system F family protein [Alphaproteobacteria bacterium]|nr:type II secretion system F family protein [Alphaproteobacteria bacterium]
MELFSAFGPELVAVGVFLTVTAVAAAFLVRAPPPEEASAAVRPTDSGAPKGLSALAFPSDAAQRDALRRVLVQAGYRHPQAMESLLVLRVGLAVALPLMALVIWQPESTLWGLVLALLAAALGYYGPWLTVLQSRADRIHDLERAFPNALDMLVSGLEAGLGLDAAMTHVTREISPAAPTLARELDLLNAELSAGIPRVTAFDHLAKRTGVEAIRSLVHVLSQAERYGAGVARSIRAHAEMLRQQRAIEAEKRAAKAAPKLTVAMVLFILPVLFVVLIGPVIVNVVYRLLPTLAGAG